MNNKNGEEGLLAPLFNKLLIPGNDKWVVWSPSFFHYFWVKYVDGKIVAAVQGENGAFQLRFNFLGKFDCSKPTVLFCHDNGGGFCACVFEMSEDCNLVCFDYVKYGYAHKLAEIYMGGKVSLSNLVEQSEIVLQSLESVLSSEKYYGSKYKRSEDLILYGRSLGGMVATKLAARLEKSGERCAKLITLVSPPNMEVAVRTVLHRSRIAHLTFAIVFLINVGFFAGMLYEIVRNKVVGDNGSLRIIIACSVLLCIGVCISVLGYFFLSREITKSGRKIGVVEEDLGALNETPIAIVIADGDLFYKEGDVKSIYKDKVCTGELGNIKIIVANASEEALSKEFKYLSSFKRWFNKSSLVHNALGPYIAPVMGEVLEFSEKRNSFKQEECPSTVESILASQGTPSVGAGLTA